MCSYVPVLIRTTCSSAHSHYNSLRSKSSASTPNVKRRRRKAKSSQSQHAAEEVDRFDADMLEDDSSRAMHELSQNELLDIALGQVNPCITV